MATEPIVIVGAGMAAYAVARELRKLDADTPLLLVTGDAGDAYAKPMLSNALALGKAAPQLVTQNAAQMATQLNATVLTHTMVESIDAPGHRIVTSAGPFDYSKLVLALGADPIRLDLAGDAAGQVLSVNHLAHYAEMRTRLDQVGAGARVVILGAGLIGCEFADDMAGAGHHVTLVDPNALPLATMAAPGLSRGLTEAWQGCSIALRLGVTAKSVAHDDGALLVTLDDGSTLGADLVLSAVGLRPTIGLAAAAQLATRRGIVIDAYGQTSAADIYALGDCAEYVGGAVLPYIAPMLAAARAIAGSLTGTPLPIVLTADAVIVKTPSYKLALAPPPAGTVGAWVEQHDGERLVARFVDEHGVLRGFGLSQHTLALRRALQAQVGAAN